MFMLYISQGWWKVDRVFLLFEPLGNSSESNKLKESNDSGLDLIENEIKPKCNVFSKKDDS